MAQRLLKSMASAGLALAVMAGGVAVAPPAIAQSASARDPGAENFVSSGAHQVLAVLNDTAMGEAAKRAAFRGLIDRLVDVPRVTRFVLGKYARTATPEQFQRFSAVFRSYVEGVYQKRIDDYHGERVTVTGSVVRKPGDVLVTTSISGHGGQPSIVVWRVLGGGDNWRVVDVQVAGVWLAITQQQDFVSTIDNAGGKVDVLINQLAADKDGTVIGKK